MCALGGNLTRAADSILRTGDSEIRHFLDVVCDELRKFE